MAFAQRRHQQPVRQCVAIQTRRRIEGSVARTHQAARQALRHDRSQTRLSGFRLLRQLQGMMQGIMQSGGTARPVSPPAMVYRIYPDGREELVRGMRFRGLNSRVLRDILAASTEAYAFDFLNTGAPFAIMGGGGYLAPTTVVSPALLFEEIELDRAQDELSRPPLVPPPPL
jgi:hypothetical protein